MEIFRKMKRGLLNNICDVKGVRVGHQTINNGNFQTGVTVILPSEDNIFQNKFVAACYVINGFGKTTGLVQIEELGTLESPIALTNTLSVGTVMQALVKYMLSIDDTIGRTNGSINVVVGECNDMELNDLRACVVEESDLLAAIDHAKADFAQGAVGAGRGMCCFEMKGGIGSASRIIALDDDDYTLGVLVLTNFGLQKDFVLFNQDDEDLLKVEQGSVIVVVACDIPLSSRQLKRVCKRISVSLSALGSHLGNGSGDIVIGFSTAQVIKHNSDDDIVNLKQIHESKIDLVFRAAIDAGKEAIMNSLKYSETTVGKDGNVCYSLKDTLAQLNKSGK